MRTSMRMQNYDYTNTGYYFVTICTKDRVWSFGEIRDATMYLSEIGIVAEECIRQIPNHYPLVNIDTFVVMPNHVHMIIDISGHDAPITCQERAQDVAPLRPRVLSQSLGAIVRGYKMGVTKIFREKYPFVDLWQRNYHERIIRDEQERERIQKYIQNNPTAWQKDILFAPNAKNA